MKVRRFLDAVAHKRIHAAIQSAEEGSSGDIVIYVSRRPQDYPLTAAHSKFEKFKLGAAKDDNSFLILIAPASQTFAVLGGKNLHAKMGQKGWDDLSALLTRHFKKGDYTDGLVAAIERVGHVLKTHFPASNVDRAGQKDIVEE